MFGIPEWALGVGFIITVTAVAQGVLRAFFPRGLATRPGGADRRDVAQALEDVQRRLDALEEGQRGLGELEERLDFAERLLAQQRDERLAPPKQ